MMGADTRPRTRRDALRAFSSVESCGEQCSDGLTDCSLSEEDRGRGYMYRKLLTDQLLIA